MSLYSSRTVCHFEGIVLKVTPFEEKGYIATVWTKEQGKLSIFFRPNHKKKQQTLTTLIKIEGQLYLSSSNSLSKCYDYSVITSYPQLRTSYFSIQEACTVCRILNSLLYEEIVSEALFEQFELFLLHCAHINPPSFARYFFFWQFAKHEGLHISLVSTLPHTIYSMLDSAHWEEIKNNTITNDILKTIQQTLEATLEISI